MVFLLFQSPFDAGLENQPRRVLSRKMVDKGQITDDILAVAQSQLSETSDLSNDAQNNGTSICHLLAVHGNFFLFLPRVDQRIFGIFLK